ncbi:hypothetical protein ABFS82_12G053000 [Erythranthe guttata]
MVIVLCVFLGFSCDSFGLSECDFQLSYNLLRFRREGRLIFVFMQKYCFFKFCQSEQKCSFVFFRYLFQQAFKFVEILRLQVFSLGHFHEPGMSSTGRVSTFLS